MAVKGVYFMEVGRFESWAGRWALDWDPNQPVTAIVYSTLIDTDDGYVVIDSGLDPDIANGVISHKDMEFIGFGHKGSFKTTVRKEDDIRKRLKEHGITPNDVRYLVNTHLHFDHVGGNRFFTESRIVVHRDEYRFAMFPDRYYALAYERSLWDLPNLHYELIEGDRALVPGVTLWHAPGHTPGHLAVVIDCPRDGTLILVGDNAHAEHNFKDRIPTGADNAMDPIAMLRSLDRVRAEAERCGAMLIPTHDVPFWNEKLKREYH